MSGVHQYISIAICLPRSRPAYDLFGYTVTHANWTVLLMHEIEVPRSRTQVRPARASEAGSSRVGARGHRFAAANWDIVLKQSATGERRNRLCNRNLRCSAVTTFAEMAVRQIGVRQ